LKFHIRKPADEDGEVWYRNKEDEERFLKARDGDSWVMPFQCDYCIYKVLAKAPFPENPTEKDIKTMQVIRRMNLDSFWSREPSTVTGTARMLVKGAAFSASLGLDPPYPNRGPFPQQDCFGYGVAVQILLYSLEEGRYDDYMQFDTIRRLRASYANVWKSSARSTVDSLSLVANKGGLSLTTCPTDSSFFSGFMLGMKKRMGQDCRPQLGISIATMIELVKELEEELSVSSQERQTLIIEVLAYIHLLFCGSLRGEEGFMLDLATLSKRIGQGKDNRDHKHVVGPLLGRFKGETGERCHLVIMANESRSGLKPRKWLEMLVGLRELQGLSNGPAFCKKDGSPVNPRSYESVILDALDRVKTRRPDLIPYDLDVYEKYGISRSFRRGSNTQAKNRGVSVSDVNLINRWRKVENAAGCRPAQGMSDNYAEIANMLPAYMRYSEVL
jgi:hypothetical protein